MITLIELFDVAKLPMKDKKTDESINYKTVLAHPDAIVKSISFDLNTIDFLVEVEYRKEPENEA